MKFAIALSALASIASVCAESIYFVATSEDKSLDFPLYALHEGAGMGYFFGWNEGEVFDLEDGVATRQYDDLIGHAGAHGYFSAGPAVFPTTFTFEGDAISNYNFFACKDTNDPYNYSKRFYAIITTEKSNTVAPYEKCTPVTVSKHAASDSASA